MPRTITINYARLVSIVAGLTSITATYVVGYSPDGKTFTDYAPANIAPSVTVDLTPTDTQQAALSNVIAAILQTEQLSPASGDHIYGTDGSRLV